jgi:hypothetical protein
LHIKLERLSGSDARILVTNLAKISVLMQMVQFRKLAMALPSLRYFLNEPLVGGTTWSEDLGKRFFACTGENYEGQIAVSITFYAAGRMYRTDWFRSQVQVHHNKLVRLDPVNISARRVRALEPRAGSGSTRRELVRDVIRSAAENDGKKETLAVGSGER